MALRATIVLWSAQGQSATSIARTLGITERTVYRCRQRWRQRGLEGLADASRPGRPARVTPAYLWLLMQTVQTDPSHLGFVFARWTCARLATYMHQRTGLALSDWAVGELLRCHGFAWRRAKLTTRRLADRGKKARAARRLRSLRKAAVRPGADFELWYADATRFDLLPVTRSMWRLRGSRLLLPTPGKNIRVGSGGRSALPRQVLPLHPPTPARHRPPSSHRCSTNWWHAPEGRASA